MQANAIDLDNFTHLTLCGSFQINAVSKIINSPFCTKTQCLAKVSWAEERQINNLKEMQFMALGCENCILHSDVIDSLFTVENDSLLT